MVHRSTVLQVGLVLALIVLRSGRAQDVDFDAPGAGNPIIPGYFADPTLRKFGDTYFLYATTDGNGGGRGPSQVWMSKNFVDWTLAPMNWPTTPFYWAPEIIERDGKYFLYYCEPCKIYGASSDSPIGPWTPLVAGDGVIVPDRIHPNVITLDPQVFAGPDQKLRMYFGTWGIYPNSGCGVGELGADMKSLTNLSLIPNTEAKDFFEGPVMYERNGIYFFTYSSGSCHDATYRVQYAIGRSPTGPFTMGKNNPILASDLPRRIDGPGHHSIFDDGGETFIVYHRHDIPLTPNGMHRQICVDPLHFPADGEIAKVAASHRGVGQRGDQAARRTNLAFKNSVTASSVYDDRLRRHGFKAEYAVDDNNATLWRPASNRPGEFLTIDLGAEKKVRRVEIQFEYPTRAYRYVVETSRDGVAWETFADRRKNRRFGSPMIDEGDALARHLKITITGTEKIGDFGAIWNVRVFDETWSDPLAKAAEKSVDNIARSRAADDRESAGSAIALPSDDRPLVDFAAGDLSLLDGNTAIQNHGRLGGRFLLRRGRVDADVKKGRPALRFSDEALMEADFRAPWELSGNASFTVAAWVLNPEIAESEVILSWGGRGGPDGTTAQIGYGTHPEWGAVGHWGFADQSFGGRPPEANVWHRLVVTFDGLTECVAVDGKIVTRETKMLDVHRGRPFLLGASEKGSEHFDGRLASLTVLGRALSAEEIAEDAKRAPTSRILVAVNADSRPGIATSWENDGTLGGAFMPLGLTPARCDVVDGRAAVLLPEDGGISLDVTPESAVSEIVIDLLFHAAKSGGSLGMTIVDDAGRKIPIAIEAAAAGWNARRGTAKVSLDGHETRIRKIEVNSIDGQETPVAALRIIEGAPDAPEIRAMQDFASREADLFAKERKKAAFARSPFFATPTGIAMSAEESSLVDPPIEYLFEFAAGLPQNRSGGWQRSRHFFLSDVPPGESPTFRVRSRNSAGLYSEYSDAVATERSTLVETIDGFETATDFERNGVDGTGWDGLIGPPERDAIAQLAAEGGRLTMTSIGTSWDGGGRRGPFLFRKVRGDFWVEVRLVDYTGLADQRVPGNNDAGLMVRKPKRIGAGGAENAVQLSFFPIWNQGNMATVLSDRGREQKSNGLAFSAHRKMAIERRGREVFLRTSEDGKVWQDMPSSPILMEAFDAEELEVGLFHASYGDVSSGAVFDDFRLWRRKAK